MSKESQAFGRNMKRLRMEKGITQGDISRSLKLARSFISNIENGKTNPTLATIVKIARTLGVPIKDLVK
ncbi:MAG: helix-turn-helix transcriptional regulator [bacterium]|nr:helix-turn-helix transcriptional regulator [bacterium]